VFPWDTGGMYTVELYARVRRAVHVEGRSQREVAREFGLARKTVRKMLAYPAPPGYSCRSIPRLSISSCSLTSRQSPFPAF